MNFGDPTDQTIELLIGAAIYGCSNGAKFSLFYYMCSVLFYSYSVIFFVFSFSSYLYSVSSYLYSVNLYVFSLILFIFSQIIYIQSHLIIIQSTYMYSSHLIYIQSTYIYSVPSYMYSVLYTFSLILFISVNFMFNVLCVKLRDLVKICSFLKRSECMSYRTIFLKEIKEAKILS